MREDVRYVTVFEAGSEIEAILYRDMLREAGINAVSRPRIDPWLKNIVREIGGRPHRTVLVPEADAEEARRLVADFHHQAETGEFALKEDELFEGDGPPRVTFFSREGITYRLGVVLIIFILLLILLMLIFSRTTTL